MYPNSFALPTGARGGGAGYAYGSYGTYNGMPGYQEPSAYGSAGAYGGTAAAVAQDPSAFEHMYSTQLAQLTFNSKPIITNLTLIAQEHMHRMPTMVAKLIDSHILMLILQAVPSCRLPGLYLLDSISKNIRSPYTELWAPRIATLFMESYRVVDQPTRRRMEELLATWRVAGPGGRPLFGDAPQWTVERSLFGSQQPPAVKTAQPSHTQVLANIDRLLALATREQANSPSEGDLAARMSALREMKDRVQSMDPSMDVPADVQQQLDAFTGRSPTPNGALQAAAGGRSVTPGGGAPNAGSASELIANLMRAGLLPSASGVSAAAPGPSAPTAPMQDKAYADYIMSMDLRLTTLDLARQPPELELLIKEHLPLQCRQSVNRYPDGEKGRRSLEMHLDWHFSQNRRSRASATRGQSRAWMDPVGRWIRSGFDDVDKEAAEHDKEAVELASSAAQKEKYAKTYVIVPVDTDVAARPCRICREKFQGEWSEDVEEWIWKNAVDVDGVYYHASCYNSAKNMSESVALQASAPFSLAPEQPAPPVLVPSSGPVLAALDALAKVKRDAESAGAKQEDGAAALELVDRAAEHATGLPPGLSGELQTQEQPAPSPSPAPALLTAEQSAALSLKRKLAGEDESVDKTMDDGQPESKRVAGGEDASSPSEGAWGGGGGGA
ncbi:hypothetical protein MSPP1_000227 [Malassezia sp. CBS 17886]|nr:hypothetical protein MSPP1_000227 [Malassezia sp. CBS 17886]